MSKMIWTAWNNGKFRDTGGGYGFYIPSRYLNANFDSSWKIVKLDLPYKSGIHTIELNVSKSFWKSCPELRSKDIGLWLIWFIKNKLASWTKSNPPKFYVVKIKEAHFALQGVCSL